MKKYSKLMAVLLVVAMLLPGLAQAAPVAAETEAVVRLAGAGRVETAVKASEEAYEGGANAVVLAGYYGEVDALAGTLLADAKNAPLLLTTQGKLSSATKAEIERLGAKTIYILGGEKVVSAAVKAELEALDYIVERVSGDTREETAAAVAEEVGGKTTHVFLAKGYGDYADALAAGPASAKEDMPILLTQTNKLSPATKAAMTELGVTDVTIVGGTSAVSEAVENELSAYTVKRIEGTNRERTAVAIANKFFVESTNAVVASGYTFADALVGGYLGAMKNAPILLTDVNRINAVSSDYMKANTDMAYILGGTTVVSEAVEAEVVTAVKGEEVEEELKVESVSAIDKTTVQVEIKESDEDFLGATIEVLDDKGNVVAVKPVDIAAGDTTVFFEFVKEVEKQEGVWTIEGHEWDFDLLAKLEAFKGAGTDQIKLNKALADLGIENVKVENMIAYAENQEAFLSALAKDKKELTVEAIQDWIDEVNAEQLTDEESKTIAKKVTDAITAGNDVAFLAALNDDAFVRVNSEWVNDYKTAINELKEEGKFKDVKVDAIQGKINGTNSSKVTDLINGKDTIKAIEDNIDKKDLNEKKDVITKYATPVLDGDKKGEQEPATKKALKDIEIQLAVVNVREATTPTLLKGRLTVLDNLLDKADKIMPETKKDGEVDYAGYVDANAKHYISGLEIGALDEVNPTAPIVAINDKSIVNADSIKTLVITEVNEAVKAAEEKVEKTLNARIKESSNMAFVNVDKYTGYNVGMYFNKEEGKEITNIVVKLYNNKELLSTSTATSKSINHVNDAHSIGAPFDVFEKFDYVADGYWESTGWDGSMFDIPTKAEVSVEYADGTAVNNITEFAKSSAGITDPDEMKSTIADIVVKDIAKSEDATEVKGLLIDLANAGQLSNFLNTKIVDRTLLAETIVAEEAETKNVWTAESLNDYIEQENAAMNGALNAVNALKNDSNDEAIEGALEQVKVYEDLKPVEQVNVRAAFVAEVLDKLADDKTPNFKSYTELTNLIKNLLK